MPRIIRIFAWILAVVVVLGVGLFLYLRHADLSRWQHQIEAFASNSIGQRLQIEGPFELYFGRTTVVVAEQVSLSNPAWPTQSTLVYVGEARIAFNTWSIVSAPFIVEALQADDIRVYVERDDSGALNWQPADRAPPEADGNGFDSRRIAFRDVNIGNVHATLIDPARPAPVELKLESISVSPDSSDVLDLDMRGSVNELPLWADGKLGPWHNFIDGRDIFADLDVSLDQVRLAVSGTVVDLVRADGVEIDAVLDGPDIGGVLDRLGLPAFATGPFEISAEISRQESGHLARIDGDLGEIRIFLSGLFDRLLRPGSVRHDFSIAGPDAAAVARLFGLEGVPAEAYRFSGDYERNDRVVTLRNTEARVGENIVRVDGQLDFASRIPDIDLSVDASGPTFGIVSPFLPIDGLPSDAFDIKGRLQKSGASWQFDQINANVGANRFVVDGSLELGQDAAAEVALHAEGPDISFVQDFTGLQGIPQRPYDITARLQSHPEGLRFENASGVFGDNVIRIAGVLATKRGLGGTDLDVTVEGPELHNVALLTGVPHLPRGNFAATGKVRIEAGALVLDGIEARVEELNGTASGTVGLGERLGDVDLDVTLRGPDAAKAAAIDFLQQFGGEPFAIQGNIRIEDERINAEALSLAIGDLESELNGSMVGAGRQIDLNVRAQAADSHVLQKLAKLDYLPPGAITFGGEIHKTDTEIRFKSAAMAIGDLQFNADGVLSISAEANRSDLNFSLAGPNLEEIGLILGTDVLPAAPFSVTGEFEGTRQGVTMRDFLLRVADSDLRGQFDLDLRARPQLSGALSSTFLDLTDKLPAEKTMPDRKNDETSDFVFPREPLDTGMLQKADIDLDISIDRLILETLDVEGVNIGIDLLDGALAVRPIAFREGDGGADAFVELRPIDGHYELDTKLAMDNLHIGVIAADDQTIGELPPFTGEFALAGQGGSVHEIMAGANGSLRLRQGSGRIKEVFATRIFRDLLFEVLRTLNPIRRDREYRVIECGIYDVSVADGVATIDTFALQTDAMTVVASGQIDLDTEALDIRFRAKPRQGIGISLGTVANSLLGVGGTLKAPTIGLDARSSVTATGAAVATGGLSLLARGVWDRLSAEADICKQDEASRR